MDIEKLTFDGCSQLLTTQGRDMCGDDIAKALQRMAKISDSSDQIEETIFTMNYFFNNGRGNFKSSVANGLKNNQSETKIWLEVIDYYQKNPEEGKKLCPGMKALLIRKALIASDHPCELLESKDINSLDETEEALFGIKIWPVEKWRDIYDSLNVPSQFCEIAFRKIEEIRKDDKNLKLT